MTSPVYIATKRSGYAHPKCYLSHTKGCSEKISGEHYISEALLNVIEKQNRTIDVTGFTWLPKEQLSSISKANLKAKILCTNHNCALSPLDSAVADFVAAIGSIDIEQQKQVPLCLAYSVDGTSIERWLIKVVYGLVVSGQIKQKTGQPFLVKEKCMSLLCSPHARWPVGWGLYLPKRPGHVYHSSSFELIPQYNPDNGLLLCLDLKFNGIVMHFVMGKPDTKESFGIHRPAELRFVKGDTSCKISFSWAARKAGEAVTLRHVGTYSGRAPGLDLPRAP
ncbi:hypothetical protein [Geminocystis sp. NIES-3709]|uniref:hypothetical protein n=1 Tax=Geminocystis sp. NIES-3709 TaxID=1617448 RepID=UPI0005FC953B|nr:hypothetical protein [Geminocystis sp. NIES-3709]BAQ64035.1 hypothetical protein GM3709_800 [Geminocystis sp. NIES-3709]